MKKITVGVVAEGPSDLVVLERLLRKIYGTDANAFAIRNLQPYVDNTSSTGYSEGGWQLVYKWCLANPPDVREDSLFGTPLFADDMDTYQCDALLVHMDSDIYSQIGDKTSVAPVPEAHHEPAVHGLFIESTLRQWLWPEGEKHDIRCILAPAVQSIETWLVAGLSNNDMTPEDNQGILRRLAELDYEIVRKKPLPANIKGVRKSVPNYERIVAVAEMGIERIIQRCPHFAAVLDKIDAFAHLHALPA